MQIEELWQHTLETYEELYKENLNIALERGKLNFLGRDFFIMWLQRENKIDGASDTDQWYVLEACPNPSFKQVVYRYRRFDDSLEMIWAMPSEDIAKDLRHHIGSLPDNLVDSAIYSRDYYDGTLWKICKHHNNEQKETNLLEGRTMIEDRKARALGKMIDDNFDSSLELQNLLRNK